MLTRRQFIAGAATVLATVTGCRLRLPTPGADLPPAENGPRPFRIALLSDTHAQDANALSALAVNGKLSRAVTDLMQFRPDAWLCDGDVADHGLPAEFEAFKKIIYGAGVKPENLLVTTGNHEFYDKEAPDHVALARFREAFGLPRPYSNRVIGGLHVVMLADEQWKTAPKNPDWAWLTAEQLRWFEKVLAQQKETFTVVCLHQPLQDTVVWTEGGNGFAGCGQAAELKAILKRNPQVKLWLSGHTHIRLEIPGQTVTRNGVTFAGLGSTFYQFMPSDEPGDQGGWPGGGGWRKDLSASQSRMLEVWPDRLVLRSRDHTREAWMDNQELTIKRT